MGDTFLNGFYPVIDASPGGKIDGMIVAAAKVDCPWPTNNTKNRSGGMAPRGKQHESDQVGTCGLARDSRDATMQTAGNRPTNEIAARKPFADQDATWARGFFNGDV